jgi:site-specific DNA-methyltransferase (adenine-specific)
MDLQTNTIICGDNVETLRTFPADAIDLVVTSPPYDNLRTYGGHSWDFEGVASELWRVIKPGGVVVWVVADATIDGSETGTSFRQALRFMEIGFRLHDTMIWEKPEPAFHDPSRYGAVWEFMFVFSKGAPCSFNPLLKKNVTAGKKLGPTYRRDDNGVSVVSTENNGKARNEFGTIRNVWYVINSDDSKHPACFPEALARDHILSWSNEGDIVLDPFSGSGTTAKMAKLMGRQYIGIEVNAEYCKIAEKRLAQGVFDFAP